jgi:hypothetical protein
MNRICLINKGETIGKIQYLYNINSAVNINKDNFLGEFVVLEGDSKSDISIVANYQPYYITDNTIENINALENMGYKINNCGSLIVANKECGIKYSVKPMETIVDIARKFNITKEEIVERNKLASDNLFIGQILVV